MLFSVLLASALWHISYARSKAQTLQARSTTRVARLLKEENQVQKRAYVPSTVDDLIPLGTAATYAVFAFSGISTVDGTVANGNIVHGDIGVAPIAITAITGFGAVEEGASNTPFVTGYIHAPPHTAAAHDDVLYAYNVAAGKSPSGAIVTGAGTLDDGVPMTPGVYRWTGALALGVGKTLTLNGACGDIFIFQTAGAITSGADSKVVLTGGLTATSVYWVSATSLSTGVGSSFSGIILASTNVVIAGTLVGAVYAQTEISLHAATISAPLAGIATTQIGSVCNVATCAINTELVNGICVACVDGSGSTGGATSCIACAVGVKFIDATGTCVKCAAGVLSCDVNTGVASSCIKNYALNSANRCIITSYARFLRYADPDFTFSTNATSSEGNCAKICASADYFRYTTLTRSGAKNCLCQTASSTVGLTSNSYFISNFLGLCETLQGSYTNCQNVIFSTTDGSCSAVDGGACMCQNEFASSCDALSGLSTSCVAGHGVISNNLCNPCRPGTYNPGSLYCSSCYADSCDPITGASETCLAGYIHGTGTQLCQACPINTFRTDDSAACKPSLDPLSANVDAATGVVSSCVTNAYLNTQNQCAACTDSTSFGSNAGYTKCNAQFSILATASSGKTSYLSNADKYYGLLRLTQVKERAMKFYTPSSFTLSDMPINLMATTLDVTSYYGYGSVLNGTGTGYSISIYSDGDMKCPSDPTVPSHSMLLVQSTTDTVSEYFNQLNDYNGYRAQSKGWKIGAYDAVNNRWPLSVSIIGSPGATNPITDLFFVDNGNSVQVFCSDYPFTKNKVTLWLVPAVN